MASNFNPEMVFLDGFMHTLLNVKNNFAVKPMDRDSVLPWEWKYHCTAKDTWLNPILQGSILGPRMLSKRKAQYPIQSSSSVNTFRRCASRKVNIGFQESRQNIVSLGYSLTTSEVFVSIHSLGFKMISNAWNPYILSWVI